MDKEEWRNEVDTVLTHLYNEDGELLKEPPIKPFEKVSFTDSIMCSGN